MVYPVIPSDNLVVIQVKRGRCRVARYRETTPYTYELELARNWAALEDAARQAVETLVGAIVEDEHYPCPEALAAQAVWA